jgi:lipid-A-disaccharide synthase
MPNLIANARIVPELIQHQASPQAIAEEAVRILNDPSCALSQRDGLATVRSLLGPPGAVGRAVGIVEEWLGA